MVLGPSRDMPIFSLSLFEYSSNGHLRFFSHFREQCHVLFLPLRLFPESWEVMVLMIASDITMFPFLILFPFSSSYFNTVGIMVVMDLHSTWGTPSVGFEPDVDRHWAPPWGSHATLTPANVGAMSEG